MTQHLAITMGDPAGIGPEIMAATRTALDALNSGTTDSTRQEDVR